MVFIPLYFLASIGLFLGKPLGTVLAWVAGGGVLYVMIYLLALSELQGWENLLFDVLFRTVNGGAPVQISGLVR